jgi:mono/diheme cytochrome c family protein
VKFIAGLLFGLLIVPFGAYLYFSGGSAPVATTDSDIPFENFFAHKALNARIAKEMPKTVPIQATEANYLAGAELYKQDCAVCHGLPLSPRTAGKA